MASYSDQENYNLNNLILECSWNGTENGTNFTYDSDDWCDAGEHGLTIKVFQTFAFCLIFLLGVVGNCLVIATFSRYRCFRLRSTTDIFLFHLAMADLLLLLTLPLQATDTHLGWVFPDFLCNVMRALYAINTYSGLLLLACISVDRYLVVAKAQKMFKLRRLMLICGIVAAVCVWLIAVLLSLPEILFSGVSGIEYEDDIKHCTMKVSGSMKMATSGTIIGVFCLSFLVMTSCYSLIARVLLANSHRRGKQQWHRQRTLKLMVALVVVFLMFQLPYTVVLSRKIAGQFCNPLLEYITCTLAYTRCSLNPILYALVGVRFRSDVLRLIRDSGCPCGYYLAPQSVSHSSITPSSPALTVLSVCSPTFTDRSYSSSENGSRTKFLFPGSNK